MRFWGISTSDFFGQSKQALKIAKRIAFCVISKSEDINYIDKQDGC
jgi:hypothetical protein